MIETGIVAEGAPVELIDGELIQMPALGGEHTRCVTILTRLLILQAGTALFVSPQGSIRLDIRSEPEPDFAVLTSLPEGRSPPQTRDVVMVIEVSDTSLMYDLNVKAPLYAPAGIPEYWVTAHRSARSQTQQAERWPLCRPVVDEFSGTDRITSLTNPPNTITVAEIFA